MYDLQSSGRERQAYGQFRHYLLSAKIERHDLMRAQNNRGRIFEEEMAPDLSPRGILSGPRNWGQAVPSEGMVQGIPRSGPQQMGKAQVSDGGVGHRGTRLGMWARPDGERPCKHHLSAQQFVKFPSL